MSKRGLVPEAPTGNRRVTAETELAAEVKRLLAAGKREEAVCNFARAVTVSFRRPPLCQ